jgi:hypothetical protein
MLFGRGVRGAGRGLSDCFERERKHRRSGVGVPIHNLHQIRVELGFEKFVEQVVKYIVVVEPVSSESLHFLEVRFIDLDLVFELEFNSEIEGFHPAVASSSQSLHDRG